MGTTINDNTKIQRATNPLTSVEVHNYLKQFPPLTFFSFKVGRARKALTYGGISSEIFAKLSGNHFLKTNTNEVYKFKDGKLITTSGNREDKALIIFGIRELNTIINLSRKED